MPAWWLGMLLGLYDWANDLAKSPRPWTCPLCEGLFTLPPGLSPNHCPLCGFDNTTMGIFYCRKCNGKFAVKHDDKSVECPHCEAEQNLPGQQPAGKKGKLASSSKKAKHDRNKYSKIN